MLGSCRRRHRTSLPESQSTTQAGPALPLPAAVPQPPRRPAWTLCCCCCLRSMHQEEHHYAGSEHSLAKARARILGKHSALCWKLRWSASDIGTVSCSGTDGHHCSIPGPVLLSLSSKAFMRCSTSVSTSVTRSSIVLKTLLSTRYCNASTCHTPTPEAVLTSLEAGAFMWAHGCQGAVQQKEER
jgi:hypothetical protein